jgi:hypothetical protein
MKAGKRAWIALAAILVLFASLLFFGTDGKPISLADASTARTGDVVLLCGTTLRGRLVRFLNRKSEFSHTGIINEREGRLFLLHADPGLGCVEEPFSILLLRRKFTDVRILRPSEGKYIRDATAFIQKAVVSHAGFNHGFRFKRGVGYYCTELVLLAYGEAGCPLLENVREGDVVFPERLLESQKLTLMDAERQSREKN